MFALVLREREEKETKYFAPQVTHWQNQLNFAIYDALLAEGNDTRNLFIKYKTLNDEWNAYVRDSRNDEIEAEYNLEWNKNPYFNFSSYIKEDMKSFLQVIKNKIAVTKM